MQNPGYMKDGFYIILESFHKPGKPTVENVGGRRNIYSLLLIVIVLRLPISRQISSSTARLSTLT